MHATTAPKVRGPGVNPLPPALIIRIGGDSRTGEGGRPTGRAGGRGRAAARGCADEGDATDCETRRRGRRAQARARRAGGKQHGVRPFAALEAEEGAQTSAAARRQAQEAARPGCAHFGNSG